MKTILSGKNKTYALWFVLLTAVYFCALAVFFWLVRDNWDRSMLEADSVSRGFTTSEIRQDTVVRQALTVPVDYILEMRLEANVWSEDPNARLSVSMSQDGKTVWSRSYAYAEFADGQLRCHPGTPVATHGKPVTLSVSGQGGIALWCGDTRSGGRFVVRSNPTNGLTVNGETLPGELVVAFTGYNQFHVLPYFWPAGAALWALLTLCGIHGIRKKNSLLRAGLTTVRRYQYLLRQLVSRDFRVKYQASALGMLWSLLNPLLMTFVYLVVFSTIFKSSIENFIIYLMSGIILFNYFSEATSLSLISIVGNSHLITKVYIPKYIFPVSKIISSAINLLISFVPLFILMAVTGVPFRKSLLLIPVLILFLVAFTLGMGLILSTLHVFFRDMQFLWSVLVTIWNFATPIFYPDTIISPSFQKLFRLNPLYHICSFSRMIILHGASPVPSNYLSCLVSSFVVLAIGLYVFRKSQDKFILYL